MGNLSISTIFIVLSMVYYQDGQQINMYLSFIFDKLNLIASAIMHLKMVSAAYIRYIQQTQVLDALSHVDSTCTCTNITVSCKL